MAHCMVRWLFCMMAMLVSLEHAYADTAPTPAKSLHITRITPEGNDVPPEREIVITFNRPVVPLGVMGRASETLPITLTPFIPCQWRWLNTTTLTCHLKEKDTLKEATRYQITVRPGITTEDGTTISAPYTHQFITERPEPRYASFVTWKGPGEPVIRVTLNQGITKSSLEKHLYFSLPGEKEHRINARITREQDQAERPETLPRSLEKQALLSRIFSPISRLVTRKKTTNDVFLVEPTQTLPLETEVLLRVEPGLLSKVGPEASIISRDILRFTTYPAFRFTGISCKNNRDMPVFLPPDTEQPDIDLCNPLAPISLTFSSPVPRSKALTQLRFTPLLNGTSEEDTGSMYENSMMLEESYSPGKRYHVFLQGNIKAAMRYTVESKEAPSLFSRLSSWFKTTPPSRIEDIFGRPLSSPLTAHFRTDHRKPNVLLRHRIAVLEKHADTDVPVYVNNLEKLDFHYTQATSMGVTEKRHFRQNVAKIPDIQYMMPLGIRSILDHTSGVVLGTLSTDPHVSGYSPDALRLFAQITPYQLHMKLGHFVSLLWVTDMQTGKAIPNASVAIYQGSMERLEKQKDILASAKTDKDGIALLPGTERLAPRLTTSLMVEVTKDNDMALLPLSGEFSINSWRVSDATVSEYILEKNGHRVSWGTTAQGVYRAGDTIHYKIYVRNQNNLTLSAPELTHYTLKILDPLGREIENKSITLSRFGTYHDSITVPEKGAVGWYEWELLKEPDDTKEDAEPEVIGYPLKVLVSDFTIAPFHVTTSLKGTVFKAGQPIEVQTSATLHSGGPYREAAARITATLESKAFVSPHPLARGFSFYSQSEEEKTGQIFQKLLTLDDKGEAATTFTPPSPAPYYGTLKVESAIRDDLGKYIASETRADYLGTDRFVGLRAPTWIFQSHKASSLEYIVVDPKGDPVAGSNVTVRFERARVNAARVKSAGSSYTAHFNRTWEKESSCTGLSKVAAGSCTFTPTHNGSYRAVASVKDTNGTEHTSILYLFVSGKEYVLWDEPTESALKIIPEKAEAHVGETARYLVHNPYPGATALVTIERFGVIDQFTTQLDGSTPVISVPIKPDYLPGFYLSVLVVSPRVAPPKEHGEIDLGKPSYRLGYVKVPVKDRYKEMVITAKPDKDTYRPREKVTVRLHASPKMPSGKNEPIELAVAVLDDAVFDLLKEGKDYFDPYKGLYRFDYLDVQNYSLLTRLVGRQKFEKKGANQGGDGGTFAQGFRSVARFMAYWNPSLVTDKEGNATVSFEAPDNLTGWRILVLGATPTDRVGLGEARFKVNQSTEIRPVLPNFITEKDAFSAHFSVTNRTDTTRTLQVTLKAEGTVTPLEHAETITLAPYGRTLVTLPLKAGTVPLDQEQGRITFSAIALDNKGRDALTHTLRVHKTRVIENAVQYGTSTKEPVETSIAFPTTIHTDASKLSVTLSPSVITTLEEAFRTIRAYPYSCFEQLLTRAMMASEYLHLKDYLSESFTWEESKELPGKVLARAANFQAPNGGMSYFKAEDAYVDPYLSSYTALIFTWLRNHEHPIPEQVEDKLDEYLLHYLRNEIAPPSYLESMTATTRAVSLAALARKGKVGPDDIERYRSHARHMSLFGKAWYAQAAMEVNAIAIAKEVMKDILSHGRVTSGKWMFTEKQDEEYQRILSSPIRDNCAILESLVRYREKAEDASFDESIFKLVRTVTEDRQRNTQEAMFCVHALHAYSSAFEVKKPHLRVNATLNDKNFGETLFTSPTNKPVTFERALTSEEPGKTARLALTSAGEGRYYYATRLQYARTQAATTPTLSGMEIRREYSTEQKGTWRVLTEPLSLQKGQLVRVDLYLSLPAPRYFVAVNDPVPSGLEPLNRALATTSAVDTEEETPFPEGAWGRQSDDWMEYAMSRWSFYHQELRHDSVRYYSEYLPAGNYHLSYITQAIAEGDFTVLPVHAEELYNPDIFATGTVTRLKVTVP